MIKNRLKSVVLRISILLLFSGTFSLPLTAGVSPEPLIAAEIEQRGSFLDKTVHLREQIREHVGRYGNQVLVVERVSEAEIYNHLKTLRPEVLDANWPAYENFSQNQQVELYNLAGIYKAMGLSIRPVKPSSCQTRWYHRGLIYLLVAGSVFGIVTAIVCQTYATGICQVYTECPVGTSLYPLEQPGCDKIGILTCENSNGNTVIQHCTDKDCAAFYTFVTSGASAAGVFVISVLSDAWLHSKEIAGKLRRGLCGLNKEEKAWVKLLEQVVLLAKEMADAYASVEEAP